MTGTQGRKQNVTEETDKEQEAEHQLLTQWNMLGLKPRGLYLRVVQQHLPAVLQDQVGLLLLLLPLVLEEGELPWHFGEPEHGVGVQFALKLLQTIHLLQRDDKNSSQTRPSVILQQNTMLHQVFLCYIQRAAV